MEKAYKLEFINEQSGSLFTACCGYSKTEPLHSFGPAMKPYHLLHYVLEGKGSFTIRRKEYHLEAGDGFLIKPDELTSYQADAEEPWSYVWVGFGGTKAAEYTESMGLSADSPIFHSENSKELYATVQDMMKYNTYGINDELRRNGLLNIFLASISEGTQVNAKVDRDRANNHVTKAIEFIQKNYCDPIKITDVADYVCVDRSYLSALFRSTVQITPQQFLKSYRMTKAVELLQFTVLSVEAVAISCGYQDSSVFSKAFHQEKGISPIGFRNKMWEKKEKIQI